MTLAEVFVTEDAERLFLVFQRAMTGARVGAVSRGVHNGRPAVYVTWEPVEEVKR